MRRVQQLTKRRRAKTYLIEKQKEAKKIMLDNNNYDV